MYVCNCNGIREREVRAAIAAGARRPVDVFKSRACTPKCAKCVCDMRGMIAEAKEALRTAERTVREATTGRDRAARAVESLERKLRRLDD